MVETSDGLNESTCVVYQEQKPVLSSGSVMHSLSSAKQQLYLVIHPLRRACFSTAICTNNNLFWLRHCCVFHLMPFCFIKAQQYRL